MRCSRPTSGAGRTRLSHCLLLLLLLQGSAAFAREFNSDRPLRRALWDAGFMRFARVSKLPSLLRQETTASLQLLRLLLRMYAGAGEGGSSSRGGDAEALRASAVKHLEPLAASMVARYTRLAVAAEHARTAATPAFMHAAMHFGTDPPPQTAYDAAALSGGAAAPAPAAAGSDYGYYPAPVVSSVAEAQAAAAAASSALTLDVRELFRETAAYGPLVLTLLQGVLAWDAPQFRANLGWLFPLLTGLVVAGSLEVRSLVAGVLQRRVAALLPLTPPPAHAEGAAALAPLAAVQQWQEEGSC